MVDFLATRRLGVVAAFFLAWFVTAGQAVAQPQHRARLSADLEERLSAGAPSIDVIVQKSRTEVEALARRYNLRIRRHLRSGTVLRLTAGQLDALRHDSDVEHLSSDLPVRSSAAIAAMTIGADRLWQGQGASGARTGAGVGVAIIDSGVDLRHPGLKSRVAVSVDFTGGDGIDKFGHGTHVAGLIAGAPGASVETAGYHGMAPGAHLINLRVLDANGAGTASDVIEAIDWAIEHRASYNIRILNLSLGGPVLQSYRDDPMCKAVERAVAAGLVVIAAAGNIGLASDGRSVYGAVTSPGNDPHVITVGALDTKSTPDRSDDEVAAFSSKGPTRYDLVLKPDVVAPGTRVVSAEAAGSFLATTGRAVRVAGTEGDGYVELSGTSMSTAVVSGAVALLVEGRPELTPAKTKALVQFTSSFMPGSGLVGGGAGSVNIARAAVRTLLMRGSAQPSPSRAGASLLSVSTTCLGRRSLAEQQNAPTGPNNAAASHFDSIVWGNRVSTAWSGFDSIVWGNTTSLASAVFDSIVWGNSWGPDSIVWGNSWGPDSIVWGNSWGTDSIVWGNSWGTDSIVWGNSWGTDSIVWGNSWGTDSIVWGNSWGTDSIVWGSSSSLWGAFDSIVWGNSNHSETSSPSLNPKGESGRSCSEQRP